MLGGLCLIGTVVVPEEPVIAVLGIKHPFVIY
jgi:hypothetical protein